ncbi:hypothetical protein BDV11DRAFT_193818 [Aspergillus similis]
MCTMEHLTVLSIPFAVPALVLAWAQLPERPHCLWLCHLHWQLLIEMHLLILLSMSAAYVIRRLIQKLLQPAPSHLRGL